MVKFLSNLWIYKKLNPISLVFFSPELEIDFKRDFFERSIGYLRVSFIFGIIFYGVFAFLDRSITLNFLPFWFIRFCLVIPVILWVLILSYSRNFRKYWQPLIAFSILIAGSGIILMIYQADYPADRTYYAGLALVLIYGFILIRLRFVYNALCSFFLTTTCIIVMHNIDVPGIIAFTNSFFLVSFNLCIMIGGYALEYYIRQEFYHRRLLGLEHQKVEESKRNLEKTVLARTRELKEKLEDLAKVKEELSDNENLLRQAFDVTNSAIWSMDINELDFLMKDVFKKILNYPSREIPPAFSYDLIHIEDKENFISQVTDIIQNKSNTFDLEYRLQNRAGYWIWVHSWGKVYEYDKHSKPIFLVGTTLDINDRKNTELELKRISNSLERQVEERTARLTESQRALVFLMEDMETTQKELKKVNEQLEVVNNELESFSYSVSHDLKAPLRAINGFAAALQEDCAHLLNETGIDFLDSIKENAKMMGTLINDLLEFSRLGRTKLKCEDTDLNRLFQSVYEELTYDHQNRDIFFQLPEMPCIKIDAVLFRQVIANLLSNAIKFTSTRDKAIIRVGYELVNDEHVFSIKDNGVGFNMKYADKLFGVFQRLHGQDEFDGYGVGLSLAKRIVIRHHGRIWAEAEIDKGAAFFFTIPKMKD